jgi:hypothetical protein
MGAERSEDHEREEIETENGRFEQRHDCGSQPPGVPARARGGSE